MSDATLHKYLGNLGRLLPNLTEREWDNIFQFIEYFIALEFNGREKTIPEIKWEKVKEILELIEKIKHL